LPSYTLNRPVPEHITLGGRYSPLIFKLRAGQPVTERTLLGSRCSPQVSKLADWSTSPRAYTARWSVQSPGTSVLQAGRLVDQFPSVQCSVVGAAPRSLNWQTGRPVPERILLGGRCSPQVRQSSKLADWSTSPRAYSTRWSVQPPHLQTGRLVDQSPSVYCSVVGAVPRYVILH